MFSCASPDSAAMIRSAASTRSAIALSVGPMASGAAIELGEIVDRAPRIRRETVANDGRCRARCADQARQRAIEVGCVSAARAMKTAVAACASGGIALPRAKQRADAGDDRRRRFVGLGTRLMMARTSRSVASARST